MAEGEGLEPTRPKPPVFKTGALPITLTLREAGKPTGLLFYALRGGQSIVPEKSRQEESLGGVFGKNRSICATNSFGMKGLTSNPCAPACCDRLRVSSLCAEVTHNTGM